MTNTRVMRRHDAGGPRRGCGVPGWGRAGSNMVCRATIAADPTGFFSREIFGCARGDHQAAKVQVDGPHYGWEHSSSHCNP